MTLQELITALQAQLPLVGPDAPVMAGALMDRYQEFGINSVARRELWKYVQRPGYSVLITLEWE